jgi:flagellar hook-associated protein 2
MEEGMGTVGLSFGSPTSGAGFNVTSTVAEIVSNLQNVETPWKNQLTALQSQDTVISNLGTLFSNLSKDMSSLTDSQGILAQKEGSSSDNNVLQLTAATSSATAGTHSVIVKNLAQTSSGYLDEITNASDALSGSLTLQVGGGKTENFVIGAAPVQPAANTIYTGSGAVTLASLVSAINSANLGVTANVLTDSTGSRLSLVSSTSGAAGQLTVTSSLTDAKMVTGSNPTGALIYNDGVDGKDASLVIDGAPMTSASNTATNLIPGVTFQLLAPSAQQSGGTLESVQVVIANDNSGVESAVNQFVTDYNSLIGAINTQEGRDSSGNPEPLFGSPTLSLLQQELLGSLNTENPNGYLDAIANAGDALSGSITIQGGTGAAHTVNVGDSSTPATLAGLASAINAANIGVTANVVTDSSGTKLELLSNTAGAGGALTVTSAITETTANTALNYNGGGSDLNNLTALGISVNNDGSLTLDANSLDSLLNTDYSGVVGFFQNANSWGPTLNNILTNAGTSSPTGILKLAQNSNSSIESTLNAEILKEQSYISAQQTRLTAELNQANQIMQQLPNELDGMNQLYSAITGYNQNR